ncbi:protease-4 [Sporomusaceae bacterium BoRhaA]|uniref:signal peptide peptidase SppA n=1 Tax=Pelorhabdus rhamnosifermentans TaxID=2772457 RepID=UPI001FE665B1|nr:signal peptide peptidase SppA [Pelorhabdus rhamnosifermentans]MBU2700700.1 protease-4 [Pelorhabdus rhamnosifermentans]
MLYKKSVVYVLIAVIAVSAILLVFQIPAMTKTKANIQSKVAVIYVEGVIMGGHGQVGILNDQGGTDNIMKQIREARDDQEVKAVVIRVNSPGGSAPASQELGEEIQKLRATGKVVVTSMGDVAASGGYWIAAVSDKIYANPATLTGSIGVYIPYSNWEELYKKIGIQQEKIKSGPYKDILSPDRPLTVEERAMVQDMVNDLYEQFVQVVATGRHMDEVQVRSLADGRVYTGHQAKDLGLVDEYGNLYDAIDGAAALAGLKPNPDVVEYGKKSPLSMLMGASSQFNLNKLLFEQVTAENTGRFPLPLALPESMR